MHINSDEYRAMVLGCWMGKNIGGTLGAPMEWRRQVNDVSFYTQELSGEPLPNDDLDIQLLWLLALEEQGVDLDAKTLGEYFLLHVTPHWSEYGMAKINMRSGLVPPLSGDLNNDYRDSCGAWIRSEIWACIAPGAPGVAAGYAYQDALIDHAHGEGTHAALFCAAFESAAFVEKDLKKLIDIGLSHIPEDCGVAGAVKLAVQCHKKKKSWREARDAILEKYRGRMHGYDPSRLSEEDRKKGFAEGQRGWDAPSNLGMLVVGLLYGEGDFGETICIAVNCGEDTDCTGATAGAMFGIVHGIDAIPQKWIEPIGRTIKTISLNMGDISWRIPKDVDNLTERTEKMARQVILRKRLPVKLRDEATDLAKLDPKSLSAKDHGRSIYGEGMGPVYQFDFFDVRVDYGNDPLMKDGVPKTVKLHINNKYLVMENVNIRWYTPEGWSVHPAKTAKVFIPNRRFDDTRRVFDFTIEAEKLEAYANRCVVELTITGRPTAMLVPVVLINGNVSPSS